MRKTTINNSFLLNAALQYLKKGFSVIPCKPDKKPFIKWEPYQNQKPTVEEVRAWWEKWPDAMIAIITGKICVIDCDNPDGQSKIDELLPDSLVFPVAQTPRGGRHYYFKMPDEPLGNNTGAIPGVDFRGQGGYIIAPPSRNGDKGYVWLPGLSIDEVALPLLPNAYKSFIKESSFSFSMHIGDDAVKEGFDFQRLPLTSNDFQEGRRDETLFHIANCLIKGGMDEGLARKTLELLALQCDPPFSLQDAQVKIDSALKRTSRKRGEISEAVREWVLTSNDVFMTSNAFQELRLTSREEQKAAWLVLNKLCKEGVMEKHGNRRGCFRVVDQTIEFMDFASADLMNFIPLQLPLNIHLKTKFFPKSVVALGGVSGMGKTLFALNTICLNMDLMPCFYFNAEMGAEALKLKLSYFPIPMDIWVKKMKVIDNWDFNNIADKIQPDAFNVVDYLEPEGDKPYNIHGVISAIIRKLKKGMALITIQKRPNSKLATGGIYSIKAATLALAMDWGKIEVIKNRFREEDKNPSLNTMNFNIELGYKFIKTGDWYAAKD